MQSEKLYNLLEYLKKDFHELSETTETFIEYLKNVESENIRIINPLTLSAALEISYADAVVLLGIAEEKGIVSRRYQAFTHNDNFSLGEFKDLNEIDDTLYCPDLDKDITIDNFYLDLVFKIE